jgi:hypothetical protein
MKKAVLTLSQFAHDLGAHQRITQTVSLVWHKQYTKASAATKQAMRVEFVEAFVRGYSNGVRNLTAEAKRNAEMAASQKFKYHISRDGAKSVQPKQTSQRIQPHLRSAAMTFLAEFSGDTLEEQLRQALVVLRSL